MQLLHHTILWVSLEQIKVKYWPSYRGGYTKWLRISRHEAVGGNMGTVVSDPTLYYDEGRYYSKPVATTAASEYAWGSVLKSPLFMQAVRRRIKLASSLFYAVAAKRRSIEILAVMGKQRYLAFFVIPWLILVYMPVTRIDSFVD